jgi:hypothetical protein
VSQAIRAFYRRLVESGKKKIVSDLPHANAVMLPDGLHGEDEGDDEE